MRLNLTLLTGAVVGLTSSALRAEPVDFIKQVQPILELNCVACHNKAHAGENGSFDLSTKADAIKGGDKGSDLVPGDAEKSLIVKYISLGADDKKLMPPKDKGGPLAKAQVDTLRQWVTEGANWPDGLVLQTVMRMEFARDVQPILEEGGPISDDAKKTLRAWVDQGAVWPKEIKLGTGKTDDKPLSLPSIAEIQKLTVDFARDVRPILEEGGPVSESAVAMLQQWVGQGANWPKEIKLAGAKMTTKQKEFAMIVDIQKKIAAGSPEQSEKEMKPYTNTIVGTTVTYAMVPIPAGQFLMGSPSKEAKRQPDEGPQHKVKVDAFWMEQCELTWDEYELFMYPESLRTSNDGATNYVSDLSDAVTRPTKPYVEMSFGMGKNGYPAISMTQHAANSYCKWLSAKTGHFYRLPTEAEWEYACRAGTTTAYFFGNDASKLDEYAWDGDNSDLKYQKVGKKKPNPWGLYDMAGNVSEWVLDQYQEDYYKQFTDIVSNPWNKATQPYPHVVRGGSWKDDPELLRSAARRGSDRSWKMQDPQLPKSIWYLTDAQFVGFRIVRPLKVPSPEEMIKYWNSGVEKE